MKKLLSEIKLNSILIIAAGSAIVAFGIYNIHEVSDITEGGILGLNLILEHFFGISPAYSNAVLTAICFLVGWSALGKGFIIKSAFSAGSFSLFYLIMEQTPRLFPGISEHQLAAAIIGAIFVGAGVGLCVSEGAAQNGDDAIALILNHRFGFKVSRVYLFSDISVLLLSLTYIPFRRIIFSLITVVLSGSIIDLIVQLRDRSGKIGE